MTGNRLNGALILAAFLFPSMAASAQDSNGQQTTIAPERSLQRSIDAYLDNKERRQNAREARLRAAGKPELTGTARALVVSQSIPMPGGSENMSETSRSRLNDAFVREIALAISSRGFTPGQLNQDPGLVEAAARFVRGEQSYDDLVQLSDVIVEGTVREVIFEDLGDPYGSSIVLDDITVHKGSFALGSKIRQESARTGADTMRVYEGDILEPGERILYVLDRDLYLSQAGKSANAQGTNIFASSGGHYILVADRFVPSTSGMPAYTGE